MKTLRMMMTLLATMLLTVTYVNCDNADDSATRTIDTEVNEELGGETEIEKTKVRTDEDTGETEVIEEETDIDEEGNVTEREVETEE